MKKLEVPDIALELRVNKLVPITNTEELHGFFGKLRRDRFVPSELEGKFNLISSFQLWRLARTGEALAFYAYHDEPDDHAKNDGWGYFTLYKCIAVKTPDGKIHLFTEKIMEFAH
jgi:hypothetical protein